MTPENAAPAPTALPGAPAYSTQDEVAAAAKAMFLYRSRTTGGDLSRIWDAELSDDLRSIFMDEARVILSAARESTRG